MSKKPIHFHWIQKARENPSKLEVELEMCNPVKYYRSTIIVIALVKEQIIKKSGSYNAQTGKQTRHITAVYII